MSTTKAHLPNTTQSADKNDSSSPSKLSPEKQEQPQRPQEVLQRQLYAFDKKISRREPLDPSYKFLLNNTNVKSPHIHKDKIYKRFGADLRERVESYMGKYGSENPAMDGRKAKIGRNRADLDVEMMKNAFKLREYKQHEQDALIKAELAATKAKRLRGSLIEEGTRRRSVEAMALGLQEKERKKKRRDVAFLKKVQLKMLEAEQESLHKKKALVTDEKEVAAINEKLRQKAEEALAAKENQVVEERRRLATEDAKHRERHREMERLQEEEEERIRAEQERDERMRRTRRLETPQQALHRFYQPMFNALWDQEFFNGSNPFRIVITKENCEVMGAPGYGDIVKTPMNLTWVKDKVAECKYETLEEFFKDIELIISNSLLYNSDPSNMYHKAANEMKKKYISLRKKLLSQLQNQN